MQRSVVLALGLVVSVVVLSGCGGSHTTVSGKVTYQDRPIVWGNVSIIASDGMSYSAVIKDDGTFTIPKMPTGPCKIGVTSPDPDGGVIPSPLPKGMGTAPTGGVAPDRPKPAPGKWFAIPDQYRDPVSSGLIGEIKKGEPLNVDVK